MTVATLPPAVVVAVSKPHAIGALRSRWRRTAEHWRAQAFRFFGILGGIIGSKMLGDVLAGHSPFQHLVTFHDWELYLLPFVVIAYRQWRPSLGAAAVDSAPGVTIVPEQVGLPPDTVAVPAPAPLTPAGDTTPVVPSPADLNIDLSTIPEDTTP